jgi:glutamate carboxypeptidase
MKASLVLVEFALRAIADLRLRPPRPVVVLLTSDEEIGSPTSRATIEAEACRAAYALVLEPPLPGGRLKTSRKGVGRFDVEVEGRAAHAGVEPEKGLNAIVELAHQVLRIQALADPVAGTTVNVGVVEGGTVPNVVPARATARVDVRVTRRDEAMRIEEAMQSLTPVTPGAGVTARGGFNRPPMERTPEIAALFELARVVGRSLGLDLAEGSTGGASDGNFTAAVGLPTLDGLGPLGAGAHAEDEHVEVESLPGRAALLAALLLEL